MKYLMIIFALFLFSCGNNLKINEEVEDLQEEILEDSLYMSDLELADFVLYGKQVRYITLHTMANKISYSWSQKQIEDFFHNERGWTHVGYNFVVNSDGSIYVLQPLNDNVITPSEITNGVKGKNTYSIHVATQGGWSGDDRTPEQKRAQQSLLIMLKAICPGALVVSHSSFIGVSKNCPWYCAQEEFNSLNYDVIDSSLFDELK